MIKKTKLLEAAYTAMRNNPKGSRKEQFDDFWGTIQQNPGYFKLLAEDYFYLQAKDWQANIDDNGSVSIHPTPAMEHRTAVAIKKREDSAGRAAKADTELAETIRPYIWLEMIVNTLNGPKKLRHCTGAELARLGGAFLEMSKLLKPNQVVDKHMSEQDLRNIWSRFGSSKRRSAVGAELHA